MKRRLKFCGSLIAIVIVAVCGYWYWINIPPKVEIPTPQMPQPNGYDYFLRAGKAFVPDEKGVDETTDTKFVKGKIYPIADKEAWLKQNAEALHLLREGLKYPALHAPLRSLYAPTPEYTQFRGLARLLIVESHLHGERGDWDAAAKSALDAIDFGYNVSRGVPLLGDIIGIAVQSIGIKELGNIIPHLDAKTSQAVAARLEQLYEKRVPYFKTVQEEKWRGQASIMEMMEEKSWRYTLIRVLNVPAFDASFEDKINVYTFSKQALLNNYTAVMDAYIASGRLPYLQMKDSEVSDRLILKFMSMDNRRSRWNHGRANTNTTITMTLLALRAFHLEKGHYPKELTELVPQYLQKVPIDPFDGINPLQYTLQNDNYKLWSIGPDGVNDNATPIINKDETGRVRHLLLSEDSKGDVVAGVNVP